MSIDTTKRVQILKEMHVHVVIEREIACKNV